MYEYNRKMRSVLKKNREDEFFGILKRTLIDKKMFRWFFSHTENIETNAHEMIMIEKNSTIENERWFFHGAIDEFIIEFLEE